MLSRLTNPLALLCSFLFFWTMAAAVEQVTSPGGLTAEIVSCSGWALNKYPKLKEFLKGGEAESYKGVHIHYVHGKTAIMTTFKDGQETEKIHLHKINDKEQLHKLFREKGFEPLEPEQIAKAKEERKAKEQTEMAKQKKLFGRKANALRNSGVQNKEVSQQLERIKNMKGADALSSNEEARIGENNARIESKRLAQESSAYAGMLTEGNGIMAGGIMASMVGLAIVVTLSRASRRKKLPSRR